MRKIQIYKICTGKEYTRRRGRGEQRREKKESAMVGIAEELDKRSRDEALRPSRAQSAPPPRSAVPVSTVYNNIINTKEIF